MITIEHMFFGLGLLWFLLLIKVSKEIVKVNIENKFIKERYEEVLKENNSLKSLLYKLKSRK